LVAAHKRTAHGIGQGQARELRAGVIEPHRAPGCIQNGHQGGNGIQRRSHKAAFHGQGAFGPLAGALRLFLCADAGVEFQAGDDLSGQDFKKRDMFLAKPGRFARQNRQRADDLQRPGDEWHAGIGAARFGAH
jgi:hypothetical protein